MYRTYSYNNMPMPVRSKPQPPPEPKPPEKKEIKKCEAHKEKKDASLGGILGDLKTDDIILIVIALALLIDDCDDKLLLIALAFVFFSDMF